MHLKRIQYTFLWIMDVRWNPPQPHLRVLKHNKTYITYYTKARVFLQLVDVSGKSYTWPQLLFENNIYMGPSHNAFTKDAIYTDTEIAQCCKHFQHPSLSVHIWTQYS